MARKNSDGKYIIAAGEVAHYVVCPEAWRLTVVERQEALSDETHSEGRKLHRSWAHEYTESIFLHRGIRLLGELLLLMILLTMLKASL